MSERIESDKGIVLQVRGAGNGGRRLSVFTQKEGLSSFFLPKSAMGKYGSGLIVPFCELNFTKSQRGENAVIIQYDGMILLDMLSMTYEDIRCWYYVAETVQQFFPSGQRDDAGYTLLRRAALCGSERNKEITALMAVLQLLRIAGFDATGREATAQTGTTGEAESLLHILGQYGWEGSIGVTIQKKAWEKVCRHTERITTFYGERSMRTAGAFDRTDNREKRDMSQCGQAVYIHGGG